MAVSSTPHKLRKKKKEASQPATSSNEMASSDSKAIVQSPAFPLVAFFWPARKNTSQWVILPLVLMVVGLFRWCTGLWGYSGTLYEPVIRLFIKAVQAFRLHPCTVTTRLRGIGWRLRRTCLYPNGTFTILNTGAWITRP